MIVPGIFASVSLLPTDVGLSRRVESVVLYVERPDKIEKAICRGTSGTSVKENYYRSGFFWSILRLEKPVEDIALALNFDE